MSNVSPAKAYVTKGKRRRQANKAPAESSDVQEKQWKRSRKQGVQKASAAMGEEVLQNMVLQFKKAELKEAADSVLRAALACGKISDHQIRSSFGVGHQRKTRKTRKTQEGDG